MTKVDAVEKLAHVNSFEDLTVYKKARQLSKRLFNCSKRFPRKEMYALTDQLRRAVRSVGAHISEAWALRHYIKHFQSKLTDGLAELNETLHWIITAR